METKPITPQTLSVRFLSTSNSRVFSYRNTQHHVEIGDIVIVNTRYGESLAQVMDTCDNISPIAGPEIIAVVTNASDAFAPYVLELKEARIRKEIESRMKKVDASKKLDVYASVDPEIALLAQEKDELNEYLSNYRKELRDLDHIPSL